MTPRGQCKIAQKHISCAQRKFAYYELCNYQVNVLTGWIKPHSMI